MKASASYFTAYREKHRDRLSAQGKAYRLANASKTTIDHEENKRVRAAYKKAWNAAHKEEVAAVKAAWYWANRDRLLREKSMRYRASRPPKPPKAAKLIPLEILVEKVTKPRACVKAPWPVDTVAIIPAGLQIQYASTPAPRNSEHVHSFVHGGMRCA